MIVRGRAHLRTWYVVLFSLYFYYKSSGIFFLLILATSIFDYLLSLKLASCAKEWQRKLCVALSVVASLSILGYFKYANLFVLSWAQLVGSNFQPMDIILPVGISFYTFQAISHTVEVYHRRLRLKMDFLEYLFYISFFPLLLSGPITRPSTMLQQMREDEEVNPRLIYTGLWLVMMGVLKKCVVADYLAQFNNWAFESPELYTGFELMMATVGFGMQIYCDFSGYSDMSIGIAAMMGFRLRENFNFPYQSLNPTEFWRRWHMSLSTWFKEYVYIPLGGNRNGLLKQYRNIAIVWLLTGFWHGANWNYILWGVYFGIILMLEKTFLLKVLSKIPKVFSHIYALFLIGIGWLIFFFTDMSLGWSIFTSMFGGGGAVFTTATVNYDILRNLLLLAICAIGSTPYPKKLYYYLANRFKAFEYASPVFTCGSFLMCTAYMVDSTFSPFLYYIF